jgi:hypothetical protein
MNWLQTWLSVYRNYRTAIGGFMAAVQPFMAAAGFTFTPEQTKWLSLLTAVGVAILGAAAKDAANHSTATEVAEATNKSQVK